MALNPLYLHRVEENYDHDHKAGVIVFECPNAQASAYAAALDMQVFPGNYGVNAARCKRTRIRYNVHPGRAYITAYYRSIREPGVAKLYGYCKARAIQPYKDRNGDIIQGSALDGVHEWRVVRGHPMLSDTVEAVILQTAYPDWGAALLSARARRGKINSDFLPNFGQASPGVLLFWDYKYKATPWEAGTLCYMDYMFLVNMNGWNNDVQSQKHVWAVQRSYVFGIDYPATDPPTLTYDSSMPPRAKLILTPGTQTSDTTIETSTPEDRQPYEEAAFGDLNAMVRW